VVPRGGAIAVNGQKKNERQRRGTTCRSGWESIAPPSTHASGGRPFKASPLHSQQVDRSPIRRAAGYSHQLSDSWPNNCARYLRKICPPLAAKLYAPHFKISGIEAESAAAMNGRKANEVSDRRTGRPRRSAEGAGERGSPSAPHFKISGIEAESAAAMNGRKANEVSDRRTGRPSAERRRRGGEGIPFSSTFFNRSNFKVGPVSDFETGLCHVKGLFKKRLLNPQA
jgi:hypothetical protein